MICFKKCFIVLFLLFSAGTNLHLLSQEQLPDTAWTKLMPEQVYQVKFAPDGKSIAVGVGNYIQIVDTESGNLIKELIGPKGVIISIDYTESGDTLLVSGSDEYIYLFDLISDKIIKYFFHKDGLYQACFFNHGKNILTTSQKSGEDSSSVIVYDIFSEQIVKSKKIYGNLWHLLRSPDNRYLALGNIQSKYSTIELWDANTFEKIATLGRHNDEILDMAFSPDGTMLASAGKEQVVKIWDVNNAKLIDSIDSYAYDIDFSTNSKYLIIGRGGYESIKLYDIAKKDYLYIYKFTSGPLKLDNSYDNKNIIIGYGRWITLFNNKTTNTSVIENYDQEFILFPNPATNLINIEFTLQKSDNLKIELCDLSGNALLYMFSGFMEAGKNTFPYNCHSLPQGIYFIKVTSPSFKATYKLIKEG